MSVSHVSLDLPRPQRSIFVKRFIPCLPAEEQMLSDGIKMSFDTKKTKFLDKSFCVFEKRAGREQLPRGQYAESVVSHTHTNGVSLPKIFCHGGWDFESGSSLSGGTTL